MSNLIQYTKEFSNAYNKQLKNEFIKKLGKGDLKKGRWNLSHPFNDTNRSNVVLKSINKRASELKDLKDLGEKITNADRIANFKYVARSFPNIKDYKK